MRKGTAERVKFGKSELRNVQRECKHQVSVSTIR